MAQSENASVSPLFRRSFVPRPAPFAVAPFVAFAVFALFIGTSAGTAFAQSGTLDTTFDPGTGAFDDVHTVAIDANGKILIGGDFTSFNGTPQTYFARLNADGTLDTTFDPGTGANSQVYTIVIDGDGKILIGGRFTSYDGTGRNRIARLNAGGTIDTSFDPGTGINNDVLSIAIDGDGKILIGGNFSTFNGTPSNNIVRLNADGTLDTTFDPGTGTDNTVHTIAIDGDGKILIGGNFSTFNGTAINRIARLNADGTLDTTFDPGTGANNTVYTITIDGDGKILIGGNFSTFNGTPSNNIVRLNADGTLDTTFDPGTGANSRVHTIAIDGDGKILIGGLFTSYDGTTRSRLARIYAGPGSVEFATATSSVSEDGGITTITVRRSGGSDGPLIAHLPIIGGTAVLDTDYDLTSSSVVADRSFDPGTGTNFAVSAIAIDGVGKILIGGDFLSYNGTPRNNIARLNADGTLDTSFDPGTGTDNPVLSIAIDGDGKILIGGRFTSYNGTAINRIARLNADGTLDTSFDPGTGTNNDVYTVAIDATGKILIGGLFTTYNGTTRNRIARLNADGTLDTTFDSGTGANDIVLSIVFDANGKILIGGSFTNYDGTTRNRIVRLNADGTPDTTFDPGTGVNNTVYTIAIDGDGKIVIAGSFTGYNGTTRNRIARLNADGTLDTSFDPGTGTNFFVFAIAIDGAGKIFIGGDFLSYNGTPRNNIARLNADGTLDTSFDPGSGTDNPVLSIVIDGDGKILIGGFFTSYDGTARNRIARLFAGMSVSWADGDSADKTVILTINDNTINNPDRTVELEIAGVPAANIGAIATHTLTILDNEPPATVISTASTTADGTYGIGATIDVTVTFSQAVTVTGNPVLALNSGGSAAYSTGTGTGTLTFSYTVAAGDASADLDYTTTAALTLNGGTISDGADNATLTLPAPGGAGSIADAHAIIIDGIRPTIASVTSSTADGTYNPGAAINITVNFSEAVTLAGGNLEITLDTGAVLSIAPFGPASSASGTYTVAVGHNSADLDAISPLVLEGGATLQDVAGNAMTDFAIPAGQSLADAHAIVIDSLPGLTLTRNGVVITLDGTDLLGDVSASGGVTSLTYTLENSGSGPLVITAVAIDGTTNTDATLPVTLPMTIAAGDSETFTLFVSPMKKGEFSGTIRIDSNLPGQSSVTITVSGTGTVKGGCGIAPNSATSVVWPLFPALALLLILLVRRRW